MKGLFESGTFTLHSGAETFWRINCDALTEDDLSTLAALVAERVGPFGWVTGIPEGGLRLAQALEPFRSRSRVSLIVDDVLTTGASMEAARAADPSVRRNVKGAVIFARGPWPAWVTPLFVTCDVDL